MKKIIVNIIYIVLVVQLSGQSNGQLNSNSSVLGVSINPNTSERYQESTITDVPGQINNIEQYYSSLAGSELRIVGRSQVNFSQSKLNLTMGSVSYRLGPGDKINVFLWGESIDLILVQNSSFPTSFSSTIASDGAISLPGLGRFALQGLTLSEARELLRIELTKKYRRFDVSISVSEPRQQVIWVTGFVTKPGLTAVPPGASVIDALAAAGGLKDSGTLRNIEVWRNGQKFYVDLYPLLFGGGTSEVLLSDGDRVIVGPLGPTVAISGAIAQPGIYEFTSDPTWEELKRWSGGPSVFSDLESARVFRSERSGISIVHLTAHLIQGDLVAVPEKPQVLNNRVSIKGPVRFQGDHPIFGTLGLKEFLIKIQPYNNINPFYGEIKRLTEIGRPEYITFHPARIMEDLDSLSLKSGDEIILYKLDESIATTADSGYENRIDLSGSLRYRGPVAWYKGMTLRDLLKDFPLSPNSDRDSLEILRSEGPEYRLEVINPRFEDLSEGDGILLKPRDKVTIIPRRLEEGVKVVGMVEMGKYAEYTSELTLLEVFKGITFTKPLETLQAVILKKNSSTGDTGLIESRSQVFSTAETLVRTLEAQNPQNNYQSPQTSTLPLQGTIPASSIPQTATTRNSAIQNSVPLVKQEIIEPSLKDRQDITSVQSRPENRIPEIAEAAPPVGQVINLKQFFADPRGTAQKIKLLPGDTVVIQEIPEASRAQKITIAGAVGKPGVYLLQPGQRLKDLIDLAGGYTPAAYPEALVLLRESIRKSQAEQFAASIQSLEQELQASSAEAAQSASNAQALAALNAQNASRRSQLEALKAQQTKVLGRLSLENVRDLAKLAQDQYQNITLEAEDYIFVPQKPEYILVLGETYNSISLPYNPNRTVADFLAQAGGVNTNGDRDEVYIIRANGRVFSPRAQGGGFLWFQPTVLNLKLEPGDTIVVPPKPFQTADWISPVRDVTTIVSQVLSTTVSTLALFRTLTQ